MGRCPYCQGTMYDNDGAARCPQCACTADGAGFRADGTRDYAGLATIARQQRRMLALAALQFVTHSAMFAVAGIRGGGNSDLTMIAFTIVATLQTVAIFRLTAALRIGVPFRVLAALFAFVPFVCFITVLTVNCRAAAVLRRAGLKPGFLGVSDAQVDRLLSRFSYRNCGYSLIGNVTGVCPECGTRCG